jgi:response regulator of citrate/malate metabolism
MVDNVLDIKFVIADDDIEMIRMHRETIRKNFPENKIYEFMNGFEACSFLEAKSLGRFEAREWVVITDYHMPIKKGVDVLKTSLKSGIDKVALISSDKQEALLSSMKKDHQFDYDGLVLRKGSDVSEQLENWLLSL